MLPEHNSCQLFFTLHAHWLVSGSAAASCVSRRGLLPQAPHHPLLLTPCHCMPSHVHPTGSAVCVCCVCGVSVLLGDINVRLDQVSLPREARQREV